MPKDIRAINKLYRSSLFLAVCLNIFAFAIFFAIGDGKFSSLDDFFMSAVLTGAYGGEYDVHMYFVNVVYGYFLRPFYAILPSVSWYSVFQYFTVFASFTALCYVVLERFGKRAGGVLAFLLLACVSPDFYLHVAFTQCAGIATAAGILLFAIGNAEKKRNHLICGIVLMIAGFVFRKEMFLLGMPTLAALLFFTFIRLKTIWKSSLIALVVLAFAYVALGKFDSEHYKGDYEFYAAYQGPRAYFGDGAFYDDKSFEAELDERGLNSLDLTYLQAWYFYDKNVFSLDSMKHLIEIADRHRYEPNYAKFPAALVLVFSDSLMRGSTWCWALLCLSLIFFSNKRNWWVPWVSIGLIAIPYTYLLLVSRVVDHVEVGVWALAVVFVLFFVDKNDILNKKQTKLFLKTASIVGISSLIILGVNIYFDELAKSTKAARPTSGSQEDWLAFSSYAKEHPDDVFLLPFERYKEFSHKTDYVFSAVEPGSWNNIHSTGYWNMYLPAIEQELEKRGVTNLIKDVTKDNVYMISEATALSLAPFYKMHYHTRLKTDTLMSFGNIKLLKYRALENEDEQTQH
jgi:hypothetical protein